jgi:hypothetical protein
LAAFENKVLRRIWGPNRDKVTGGWRKQHYVELCILYFSLNMRKRCIRHLTHTGELRNLYKILVGKPEGNSPLRRPRRIWGE